MDKDWYIKIKAYILNALKVVLAIFIVLGRSIKEWYQRTDFKGMALKVLSSLKEFWIKTKPRLIAAARRTAAAVNNAYVSLRQRWIAYKSRPKAAVPVTPRRHVYYIRRVVVVLVILGLFGTAVVYYRQQTFATNLQPVGTGPSVLLTVPAGSTATSIGVLLQKEGLIRDSAAFSTYVRRRQVAGQLQAGLYDLAPQMTVDEIIEKLIKGQVVNLNIRVTIPEGLTIPAVGALLERRGLFSMESFVEAANTIELPYDFIKDIPQGTDHYLEGYLFPDTYELPATATPEQVIRVMAARFNQLVPPRYAESELNKEYTLHEVVTMASIVEKEAVKNDERARIAGVFYNRLDINMLLQSCATIQYILGEPRALLYVDLEIVSPYNTYLNAGLPPGPISGSGLRSFEAALTPESHELFFFVARPDGSHVFTRTFAEHQRAIAQINAGN